MTTVYIVLAGIAVIIGALIVAYGKGASAGKTSVRADVAEGSLDAKKGMDQALNNSAKTHEDTVKELRDGGKL